MANEMKINIKIQEKNSRMFVSSIVNTYILWLMRYETDGCISSAWFITSANGTLPLKVNKSRYVCDKFTWNASHKLLHVSFHLTG